MVEWLSQCHCRHLNCSGGLGLISIPFGVLAAIYLSEFSSGSIAQATRFATNVLSGVPSINHCGCVCLWGNVLTIRTYSAWLGVLPSILMLPIVRTTDEALQLVPQELRAAGGLGGNYFKVSRVVLPAALPAIITGTTLAIARAAGETAPLLFSLFTQFGINWNGLFDQRLPWLC